MFCFSFNDCTQKPKQKSSKIKQVKGEIDKQIQLLYDEDHEQTEIIREIRDIPPVHYLFKIKNFSHLRNAKIESTDFEVGGYKWRLRLSHYPKGNNNLLNEKQHLSLYLRLSKSNSLPTDHHEVNVYFKLFVYNQIQDKYMTVQEGRTRPFRGIKKEWGFDKLLPLDVFKDESNGYLINDICVFGAEVFVVDHNTRKGDCAYVVKELGDNNTYTWRLQNFEEKLKEGGLYKSEVFAIGEHKWSLSVDPNVIITEKGRSMGMYLHPEALNPGDRLNVEFVLRVKDQLNGKHHERLATNVLFSAPPANGFGFRGFILLSKLNDTSKGYIVNGAIVFQVQISSITIFKEFS